jgi:hypothetical protein
MELLHLLFKLFGVKLRYPKNKYKNQKPYKENDYIAPNGWREITDGTNSYYMPK